MALGHDKLEIGHLPPSLLDLMEGNVKGVMKVILAIAERYQPKSVKPRSAPEPGKTTNHNADTNLPRQDLIRPYTHPQTTARLEYGHSLSQPAQSTYHGPSRYPPASVAHITEDMYSSPIDQLPVNKPPQVYHTPDTVTMVNIVHLQQVISGKKKIVGSRGRGGRAGPLGVQEPILEEAVEGRNGSGGMGGMVKVEETMELVGEIGAVVTGLTEFKTELLQLHAIVR